MGTTRSYKYMRNRSQLLNKNSTSRTLPSREVVNMKGFMKFIAASSAGGLLGVEALGAHISKELGEQIVSRYPKSWIDLLDQRYDAQLAMMPATQQSVVRHAKRAPQVESPKDLTTFWRTQFPCASSRGGNTGEKSLREFVQQAFDLSRKGVLDMSEVAKSRWVKFHCSAGWEAKFTDHFVLIFRQSVEWSQGSQMPCQACDIAECHCGMIPQWRDAVANTMSTDIFNCQEQFGGDALDKSAVYDKVGRFFDIVQLAVEGKAKPNDVDQIRTELSNKASAAASWLQKKKEKQRKRQEEKQNKQQRRRGEQHPFEQKQQQLFGPPPPQQQQQQRSVFEFEKMFQPEFAEPLPAPREHHNQQTKQRAEE